MITDLGRIRNIGISAHIDSGKTTLTERILFYTGRIRAIHEVKGKDGVGATMDSMELERERGITIQSAATHTEWLDHQINIIDTPGHVDFTIEVERALKVLDGAILVLCSVAGVQSQSITVDRQMRRYSVPRIAFVNKCDRSGANPARVTEQLREKLKHNAVMMQIPIGLEDKLEGVIDLVKMRAFRFEGENGEQIIEGEIPASLKVEAELRREVMLDAASMFSDELMEALLEGTATEDMIHTAVRNGVLSTKLTPVFMGSAYKNKGVQLLLDAVTRYLPAPTDIDNTAIEVMRGGEEREFILSHSPEAGLVANAFKLEEGPYGQLTYVRVYQGTIRRSDDIYNSRTGKKVKVGRLGRMHASQMEEITEACSGDIIALFGVDCASGDTFTHGDRISLSSMHVPEPVVSLAIVPSDNKAANALSKALHRFTREDPTFRAHVDDETGDTIISGMGELHLEVYIERIKREFGAGVTSGAPQVKYRETITCPVDFDYTHKKQTGGSGQYAKIQGTLEPSDDGSVPLRQQGDRRQHPVRVHQRLRKGLCRFGRPRPVHRCTGAGPARDPARRRLARGRLQRHGLPGGLPRRGAQVLQPRQAGGARAPDAGVARRPHRVPGRDDQDADAAPRRHRRHDRGRRLRPRRCQRAPGRDVRLRVGAAFGDGRQGRVHDGVRTLRPGPGRGDRAAGEEVPG
jgi:elongation factor G